VRADLRFTLLPNARMLRQRNRGIDRMDVTDGGETPHWQRTLWTMVGVQFVMSISFSILSPIMPLFLPELGVFSRDAVAVWAGVLASITSFVAIFTAPLWGSLADRYGRKLMVLRSTLGIAIFTLLMGLAQSPWHMVAIRAGMGALAGFNSAATLLVSTQVPENRLGSSLGWLGTGQLVGSLIGPIIGGGVADLTGSFRIPFFFAGVISLVAFAGTWWFVPERFTPPTGVRQRRSLLAGISVLTRTRGLVPLIVVMLMAQFATQAVQPVVTLFVQEMLGDRPDLATLGGLAFSVTGMAGVLAVPVLGRRSDVIGYRTVLLICLFGAALFTAPQAVPLGYWAFVVERFGLGLFVGGILPAANSLIGRLTTVTSRGFVYGMVSSAYFVGNTLGPLTGGTIAATVGIRFVFVVTAAFLLINLIWVWFTVPEVRTEP
jgi:DHA1 family multidrug resistance protein-like MFS transporter